VATHYDTHKRIYAESIVIFKCYKPLKPKSKTADAQQTVNVHNDGQHSSAINQSIMQKQHKLAPSL